MSSLKCLCVIFHKYNGEEVNMQQYFQENNVDRELE